MAKPQRKRRLGRPRAESQLPGAPPTPERILRAAEELFCEAGYAAASMSAIAERADLTSGAIYAHFDSKADLLLAVVKNSLEESPLNDLARKEPEQRDAGQIPRLISMYADPERLRLRRLAVEVHAAALRDKRVDDLLSDGNRRVVDAYREQIELPSELGAQRNASDSDYIARFLQVIAMGLSHLDTLDPALIGDPNFRAWLEQVVAGMLENKSEET